MGEMSPPTAADYAWSAAEDAKRKGESLQEQVNSLAKAIEALTQTVGRLRRDCETAHGAGARGDRAAP